MRNSFKTKSLDFSIEPVQSKAIDKIRKVIEKKIPASENLGMMEMLAIKVCLIQNNITPVLSKPLLVIFAGDHGISNELLGGGVNSSSLDELKGILSGNAPVQIFSRLSDIDIKIVDAGMDFTFPSHHAIIDAKIRNGTKNFLEKPAMKYQECRMAMDMAASIVDNFQDEGTNVIGFGNIGSGINCSACVILHLITDFPIEECVGNSGMTQDQLHERVELLLKAVEKHVVDRDDPMEILTLYGGYEIAMMVGGMLRAAELRMTILVDGFSAATAALVASSLYPNLLDYCIFAHLSEERGHQPLLTYLGVDPLLQLDLGTRAGSGVALAYPIVKAAVALMQ